MTRRNSIEHFFWRIVGLSLLAISIYVWGRIGFIKYITVSFIFFGIFGYLYNFRWGLPPFPVDKSEKEDSNKLIYSAMFWPAAIAYFPVIFMRKERERKERIIREIIES